MTIDSSPGLASIRVGERGRMNLPAQLRALAHIEQGDLLVVTSATDGEIVFKTPRGIREYIHSGVIAAANGDEVRDARRDETAGDALEHRLNVPPNPDAARALLDALGL